MTGGDRPQPAWSAWGARILALVAAVALAFSDVLPAARGLFFRDHVLVFRPRWGAVFDALAEGRWPGLTRASPGGVPLEQMLNATWTPTTALLFAGDFDVSYDVFIAAHYVVLGVGTLVLARTLGAERESCLVAAAVAALSGPVIASENLFVMLQGLAWVPWVGAGLARLFVRPSALALGGTALALGFHLQGITPVVLVLDLAAAGALVLHLRPRLTNVAWAVGAGLLGLAVAAVELFPVLASLSETSRGRGFAYDVQSGWALHPPMLLELFVPSFWAPPEHPILNVPWATGTRDDPPYFTTLYFGTTLALVAAGGWSGRARKGLIAVVVVAGLIAAGHHTPLHRWLVSLPLLTSSRYAIKYTLLASAALAALAALAVPVVQRHPRRLLYTALAQSGLLLAAWVVVDSREYFDALKAAIVPLNNGIVFEGLTQSDLQKQLVGGQKGRLVVSLAAAMGLAGLSVGLEQLRGRGRTLLAVVIVLDLALAASSTIAGADLERHRLPDAARAALSANPQRYWVEVPGSQLTVHHQAGATYFDDMMRSLGQRGHHTSRFARLWMDLDLDGQSHPVHKNAFAWITAAPRPQAFEAMGRLGVAQIASPAEDLGLERVMSWPVAGETPQHLYRAPRVRPYVSGFSRWVVVAPDALSSAPYLEHLTAVHTASVALVTHGLTDSSRTSPCPMADIRLEGQRLGPEQISVSVNSACPTLVVVQEVAFRGWQVTVDQRPAPLVHAEAGYLAALVPAGEHAVEFAFAPRSKLWAGVSLAALLAVVALLGVGLRRRLARTDDGVTPRSAAGAEPSEPLS